MMFTLLPASRSNLALYAGFGGDVLNAGPSLMMSIMFVLRLSLKSGGQGDSGCPNAGPRSSFGVTVSAHRSVASVPMKFSRPRGSTVTVSGKPSQSVS